jgi:hypothetical protein
MAGQRFFFEARTKAKARSRAPLLNPPCAARKGGGRIKESRSMSGFFVGSEQLDQNMLN